MRKQSVKVKYLLWGFFLFLTILAFFTRVLLPLETTFLDIINRLLLGYKQVTNNTAEFNTTNNGGRVIAKRSDEFQSVFTIDRGVPIGTKVLSGDVFVGVVIGGGSSSSKVQSIASPSSHTQGVFENSGIPSDFEGRGAGLLSTKIPRGITVAEGDTIVHDEGRKLIIGTVAEIIDILSDPFLTVIVQSPINITTLKNIEILTL
ncbi:MAG: hypothetical protein UY14_C0010G0008 [Parcubacteria group bacterium GW2011_GWA1_47_9]|nr:MAG: hypothetical protein UY14_C0010G0008 [Parcubacteria group bacterium GW2011_GWA1_47_9]